MCRLVAYAGPPLTVRDPVYHGSHSLYRQSWEPRELRSGSVNADGWGVLWWPSPEGPPLRLARAEPIWYDPEAETLLAGVTGGVIQATLRNATPGLPVDRASLLPLQLDGWGFSLNGWIPDFRPRHMRALRAPLTDRRYAQLTGVSDAETLFLRLLDLLDEGADPLEAMRDLLNEVEGRLEARAGAPLTLMLSSSDAVYTLHSAVGDAAANSLYLDTAPAWAPGGSLLASERLDERSGWTAVRAGDGVVQRRDGGVDISR